MSNTNEEHLEMPGKYNDEIVFILLLGSFITGLIVFLSCTMGIIKYFVYRNEKKCLL